MVMFHMVISYGYVKISYGYVDELCFGIANGRVLNFGALYT